MRVHYSPASEIITKVSSGYRKISQGAGGKKNQKREYKFVVILTEYHFTRNLIDQKTVNDLLKFINMFLLGIV